MKSRSIFGALAILAAAGCAELPKDPDGTLKRVRAEGEFRVGIIAPGADMPDLGKQRRLIGRVVAATGAEPRIEAGPSERLLSQVEKGELDLVIGELSESSPWRKRVTLLPPLEPQVKGEPQSHAKLHAVARNGENAWIALLYRQAKAISGESR